MSPAEIMRAVAVCQSLIDLADWEPIGARIDALRAAVGGAGGVTDRELTELEEYGERWQSMRPDLRAFYRALCTLDQTASTGLWRILHGGPRLEDWQIGKLSRLWEEAVGTPPAIEICPRRRREW